jgi:hypothetical protein
MAIVILKPPGAAARERRQASDRRSAPVMAGAANSLPVLLQLQTHGEVLLRAWLGSGASVRGDSRYALDAKSCVWCEQRRRRGSWRLK